MSKRIESKYKIDRRLGENIWGRPKSPVNRREYGPGEHGQRRRGKTSEYGIQLRAKQKLKGYYGNITEKQFKRTYHEASRLKGDTGENLIGLLERRLDAIVYRAKFVPTVFSARQAVGHGRILVNGQRVTIPSYRVKEGDVIEVKEKMRVSAIRQTILILIMARAAQRLSAYPRWLTCLTRFRWNQTSWSSSTLANSLARHRERDTRTKGSRLGALFCWVYE